jgi:hypothetical protein
MSGKYEAERVARLRDYPLEELMQAIPYDLAVSLDMHQQDDQKAYQTPTNLWPQELESEAPLAVDAMTNNTAMYDDELEELMYEDGLLLEYTEQRRVDPGNEQLSSAIRARRTILARLLIADDDSGHTETTNGDVSQAS